MVMSPVWLLARGAGVRMQSRESESDSLWLCLEEVAQPGQPISFSQQTTQTQMRAI